MATREDGHVMKLLCEVCFRYSDYGFGAVFGFD